MPLYEYRCNECNSSFEKIVSFSQADRLPVCPTCQSQNTQKKLSRIAVLGNSTGSSSSFPGGNGCGSNGNRFS